MSALGIATVKSDSEKLQTAAAFGPILKSKRRCERSERAEFAFITLLRLLASLIRGHRPSGKAATDRKISSIRSPHLRWRVTTATI